MGVRFKADCVIKINVVYLLCLFIITVVKALLVFYFNVGSLLDLYKTPSLFA
jgi:hypothetical protein